RRRTATARAVAEASTCRTSPRGGTCPARLKVSSGAGTQVDGRGGLVAWRLHLRGVGILLPESQASPRRILEDGEPSLARHLLLRFLDVELDVHNRSGFWSVCHDDTFGPVEAAGVFNDVREGSRKVRELSRCARSASVSVGVRSCEDGAVSPPSDSVAFADLAHPFDLALNDLGLPDVPPRVEAPRDEGQGLLGDRLGVREIRRDPDDREGPRGRRVQVSASLV